jgi:Hsp90 protein
VTQCSAALPTAGISHGVHAAGQGETLLHALSVAVKPCMHACMQEEAQEYVQEQKLRDLVNQYSEFINFPIYMYTSKQVSLVTLQPMQYFAHRASPYASQPLYFALWVSR